MLLALKLNNLADSKKLVASHVAWTYGRLEKKVRFKRSSFKTPRRWAMKL